MIHSMTTALYEKFRTLRMLYFIYLLASILALLTFFIDKRLTLLILGVSILFHFTLVRPKSKSYERQFIHACAQLTLERHLSQAAHSHIPVLSVQTLRRARLIPENGQTGSITLHEGGTGQINGCSVTLGDAVFCNSFLKNGKNRHQFVYGCWIQLQLPDDTGLDWRLVHKNALIQQSVNTMQSKNPNLLGPEDYQALPRWVQADFFILREQDTPSLPPLPVLEKLHKLACNTALPLAICIQGGLFHVFLINRLIGQKVSVREMPTEERLQLDFLPELEYIISAAKALSNTV